MRICACWHLQEYQRGLSSFQSFFYPPKTRTCNNPAFPEPLIDGIPSCAMYGMLLWLHCPGPSIQQTALLMSFYSIFIIFYIRLFILLNFYIGIYYWHYFCWILMIFSCLMALY